MTTLNNIGSGFNRTIINDNFEIIQEELKNKVVKKVLDSGENNSMLTDLDMNSKRILNSPSPLFPNDLMRLQDVQKIAFDPSTPADFVFNEESIELTNTQVNVVFISIFAVQAAFFITDKGVDIGRLVKDIDYTVVGETEIQLTNTFPTGSTLTGVSAEPVGGSESILKESRSEDFYKRSLVHEFAFSDDVYKELETEYGYSQIYPSGIAVDEEANEVIISRGPADGSNNWIWFWVYNLATGAFKTVFTSEELTWESLVIRYVGTTRYLYAISRDTHEVYRMNITILPVSKSTVAIADRYDVEAHTNMTYDGEFFYVSKRFDTYKGTGHRHIYGVFDVDFNEYGRIVFPIEATGTFGSNITRYVKQQGITFHDGEFLVAAGRIFKDDDDVQEPQFYQGINQLTANGNLVGQYLSRPDLFKEKFESMVDHVCTLIENEGIYSTNGNVYATWVTLDIAEWTDPAFAGKGIALTKELSKEGNRVDFSNTSVGFKYPFNSINFQREIHFSNTSLTYPLRDTTLTSLVRVIDMMRDNDLNTYSFAGDNQSLIDVAGNNVPTANNLIEVKSLDGEKFVFRVTGPLISREYWITLGNPNSEVIKNIDFT